MIQKVTRYGVRSKEQRKKEIMTLLCKEPFG